ncbi:aldo/keto reductase [Coraliomargarita algicola]|uniref:Aldo/keto reductase n=1 Tax=Coraliomargarita algicola TaxID=3092156 RepID=A0ABZ0RF95_9BACT|nr:aldo/keto reductase [Coraliomargarita sp. J2-16]WPJ94682.1 aldo/keto reductase [Coraliomargarita sp. J2-16]
MNQRKFGRTGLSVSELCLGALQLGWLNDADASFNLLDTYRELGGNFIQTSTVASNQNVVTQSEQTLGAWLSQRPGVRQHCVLSTRMVFSGQLQAPGQSLARLVREQCEASLRRLGVSHLDLLVCEWDDCFAPNTRCLRPMDELFVGLENLIRAGIIRYVGAAGFPSWRFVEALGRSDRLRGCRFDSLQQKFSILEQGNLYTDVSAIAREYKVGFLAESPLAGGFLTGKYGRSEGLHVSERAKKLALRYANRRGFSVIATLEAIGRELNATPAQVALAWVLRHEIVSSAIIGCNHSGHVHTSVAATQIELSNEHVWRLEYALAPIFNSES